MAVNPHISFLLDIYGEMLTEKERDALELYYNEDLSLSEIADNELAERSSAAGQAGDFADADTEPGSGKGYAVAAKTTITRQGVRDAIKRAENKLFELEKKLGLAGRLEQRRKELDGIAENVRKIREYNSRYGRYPEIERLSAEIAQAVEGLYD